MPYPRRLLLDDERIVAARGLHVVRVLPNILTATLIFAGLGAGFFLWRDAPSWFGLALGVIFIGTLGYLFVKLLSFRSTQLVVTTKRLIFRSGVVRRRSRDVALDSLIDVQIQQRLTERVIGLGSLNVTTSDGGGVLTFRDISRPREFRAQIFEAKDHLERGHGQQLAPAEGPVDVVLEVRRLRALHRKGIITEAELEAHIDALGLDRPAAEIIDDARFE